MPDALPPTATDPRIAAIAAALPEGAGDPAAFRYDPGFEGLDQAIRTGEREGPSKVDWARLSNDAQAALATRSKDLLIACWFAHAAMRVEGLPGLAAGLGAVTAMAAAHWETMFPPPARERARIQAVEWLAARTAPLLPPALPPGQGAAAIAARDAVDALQALLDARLTGGQASLGDLVRAIRPLAEAAERAAAPPPPAAAAAATPVASPGPAASAPTPRPAAPAPIAPVTVPLPEDANVAQAIAALREAVRAAALRIIEAEPREPRGYALLRAITWLQVTEAPPVTAGRTAIIKPPETRLTEFEALRAAANWAELSLGLERFLSGSGMFWLDGQRLAHQALLGQGPAHAGAAREVARGLGLLLGRLPGLVDLAFEDATPFADATTRGWIQREVLAGAGGGAAGDAAVEPWDAGLERARGLAGEGQVEAAVALLAAGAATAGGGRARLRWRIALGRLLLENGLTAVALPIAEAAMTAARPMTEWEPEAAAEAVRLLAACLGAKEAATVLEPAALAEARRRVAAELALLDPIRAMRAGAPDSV